MYTFGPALTAEIAYRREDVRASFRSTRRLGARTSATRRGTTWARATRSLPVARTVTHRAA